MDLGLNEKVALVTASSKGIGFGVAKVLASEGCKVAICLGVMTQSPRAKDQIVRETGNREVYAFNADLTVKEDIERLVKNATEKFGGVDILALQHRTAKTWNFQRADEADWDKESSYYDERCLAANYSSGMELDSLVPISLTQLAESSRFWRSVL